MLQVQKQVADAVNQQAPSASSEFLPSFAPPFSSPTSSSSSSSASSSSPSTSSVELPHDYWRLESDCHGCHLKFNVMKRKHWCRRCGHAFHGSCSSLKIKIPQMGFHEEVRVCDACFDKVAAGAKQQQQQPKLRVGSTGGGYASGGESSSNRARTPDPALPSPTSPDTPEYSHSAANTPRGSGTNPFQSPVTGPTRTTAGSSSNSVSSSSSSTSSSSSSSGLPPLAPLPAPHPASSPSASPSSALPPLPPSTASSSITSTTSPSVSPVSSTSSSSSSISSALVDFSSRSTARSVIKPTAWESPGAAAAVSILSTTAAHHRNLTGSNLPSGSLHPAGGMANGKREGMWKNGKATWLEEGENGENGEIVVEEVRERERVVIETHHLQRDSSQPPSHPNSSSASASSSTSTSTSISSSATSSTDTSPSPSTVSTPSSASSSSASSSFSSSSSSTKPVIRLRAAYVDQQKGGVPVTKANRGGGGGGGGKNGGGRMGSVGENHPEAQGLVRNGAIGGGRGSDPMSNGVVSSGLNGSNSEGVTNVSGSHLHPSVNHVPIDSSSSTVSTLVAVSSLVPSSSFDQAAEVPIMSSNGTVVKKKPTKAAAVAHLVTPNGSGVGEIAQVKAPPVYGEDAYQSLPGGGEAGKEENDNPEKRSRCCCFC